eukprot:CAMPEP_0202374632 /NCGR_PEP_ID=MMETSP1127-20130417/5423_1 /ASSEMBLY_ACC=CAM_ASM_000462 /TAXON_ID=3047 /ORGANISM="Dunaliella tertiolecta, Strain CCMP1320" /LENGTH=152 /DNA_ID=CAMNT_0048971839 /DNA_START=546 /DNA_END=1004 /DNA_ORIENTATION=-
MPFRRATAVVAVPPTRITCGACPACCTYLATKLLICSKYGPKLSCMPAAESLAKHPTGIERMCGGSDLPASPRATSVERPPKSMTMQGPGTSDAALKASAPSSLPVSMFRCQGRGGYEHDVMKRTTSVKASEHGWTIVACSTPSIGSALNPA